MPEPGSTAAPALTLRQANCQRYDIYRRGGPPHYKMSDEERDARRVGYAARDRAHAAVIRAKRAHERALAKEADAARMAVEVDRIRSEIRVSVKSPTGRLAAIDAAGMLILGPQGAVGCGGALLRTLEVLVGKGRHPVPSLLAVGPWQDEAALRAALDAFRPKLAAIGLWVCRRKAGWRLAKAAT
ncbi:hypothetical protein GOFOIKOB_3013 [Methylobacterium tardum]|uniref:Uncharacterized protein n=2 Tax=Methylobacterium tardum TaxID=374432 RepID=A0AA37WRJ0_9HYPH|nr:hypothetical protein [Methylobacterium tardum]GJE49972.1 hypothetical protein GOFOIKOB_3013 [Methylobacterium tardum]GLS70179.1 hypothetical protein GCM10007890_21920 [Methylobacterium tardum]